MKIYLDGLARDFRYAFRNLRKNRRFSLVAVLALALGIGASTVVFSVVYNSIFRALPYRNFQRLVVFGIQNLANAGGWKGRNFFSPAEFRGFREQNHVFEDMIAYEGVRLQFDDGKSIRYWPMGATVSGNTFEYLGVAPYLGRSLSEQDAKPDAPFVFVMNYRFWRSEFGGDPKILGRDFILEGKPRTLVGIMPRHFNAFNASFYVPVRPGRDGPSLDGGAALMGRLKPGVTLKAAGADLDAIAHRLQKENPQGIFPEKFAIVPQMLVDSLIGDFKKTLYCLARCGSSVALDRLQQRSEPAAGSSHLPRKRNRHARDHGRVPRPADPATAGREFRACRGGLGGRLRIGLLRAKNRRLTHSWRHAPR